MTSPLRSSAAAAAAVPGSRNKPKPPPVVPNPKPSLSPYILKVPVAPMSRETLWSLKDQGGEEEDIKSVERSDPTSLDCQKASP
ncbi:hypothetical protein NL676_027834 [Syzygium grande]|nr:hypothetical protein NL676_027834 [Syzygium grande]